MSKKNFKIGLFGASFNPLHLGHLNLLVQVQELVDFDLIKVIPAYQSPFHPPVQEVPPKKRLAMVRKVFKDYSFVEVDPQEIKREGPSYTIDTLKAVKKDLPKSSEIFLIMGIDQFSQFDKWKDFSKIIEIAHLLVCSRQGYEWNLAVIPPALKKYIEWENTSKELPKKLDITTGKRVYFHALKDMDISSSQIRQRHRQGLPISHLVSANVNQWIQKQGLYPAITNKENVPDPAECLQFCIESFQDKKAQKIKKFDLRKTSSIPFDFTLVVSGLNTRHTKMMASHLQRLIRKKFSMNALHIEGQESGEWIVLDYGLFVLHIFYDYTREYYQLEELWSEAPQQLCT